MLMRIPYYIVAIFILQLFGCSKQPPPSTYQNNGISLVLAENWVFSKDSDDSLFGEREIIFRLGEASFAAFYFQNEHSNFSEFIDFYLRKTQPNISQPETKTERVNRRTSGYDTVITKITSQFAGEIETTTLYSVNINNGEKNIYFMSLIAAEEKVSIDDDLKAVLESLSLEV